MIGRLEFGGENCGGKVLEQWKEVLADWPISEWYKLEPAGDSEPESPKIRFYTN